MSKNYLKDLNKLKTLDTETIGKLLTEIPGSEIRDIYHNFVTFMENGVFYKALHKGTYPIKPRVLEILKKESGLPTPNFRKETENFLVFDWLEGYKEIQLEDLTKSFCRKLLSEVEKLKRVGLYCQDPTNLNILIGDENVLFCDLDSLDTTPRDFNLLYKPWLQRENDVINIAITEDGARASMREAMDVVMARTADYTSNLYLIVCDMGNFPRFQERHPERYINVGIQEPNAVSIAAGLALDKNIVFMYSVAGFLIHRAFEQLKFDVCHRAPDVKIINAGAGLCYNQCGAGHFLVDDFALMSTLPYMKIGAPLDLIEFIQALYRGYEVRVPLAPMYIRTGMDDALIIPDRSNGYLKWDPEYKTTVVTTGFTSQLVYENSSDLHFNHYHVKYLDEIKEKKLCGDVIVIEDHIEVGGLGSRIPEKVKHVHLPIMVDKCFETQKEALNYYGFSKEVIRKVIWEEL